MCQLKTIRNHAENFKYLYVLTYPDIASLISVALLLIQWRKLTNISVSLTLLQTKYSA